MSLLSREQILKADDLPCKIVDMTKEWGGEVKVRAMSLREQFHYEDLRKDGKDLAQMVAYVVGVSCVDENNTSLFTQEDIEALKDKDWKAVLRLFDEAMSLNLVNEQIVENKAKN